MTSPREEYDNLSQEVDRTVRSYITAVMLQNEEEMERLWRELCNMMSTDLVIATMLSTAFNLVNFLISQATGYTELEDKLGVWVNLSRDIELSILLDGDESDDDV